MEIMLITYWHWLIIAVALLIIEVLSGTFVFLWLSAACVGVAVVVYSQPGIIWQYQFAFAAAFILLSIFLWKIWGKIFPAVQRKDNHNLNRRSEQYIGRTFTLCEPIVNGIGKIKVDDSSWRVEGDDAPVNTRVEVIAADGILLKVRTIK
jgi:membrane protein implicated in regulation of membrane protease activity